MFEGIAADLLSRHLGDYIEDLNREKLKVAVWAGDLVLENLKVKRDAFDALELPIEVISGSIGRLEAHVPWSRLKTEPVIVVLDHVLILVGPKDLRNFSQRDETERQQRIKQRRLEEAELMKQRDEPSAEEESLTSKLATKIIDNIQVKINNVHIRYEDAITDPARPFSMGVTWSGMDACSSLANWEPTDMKTFKAGVSELVYKLVTMRQSSVYLDMECDLLSALDPANIKQTLNNMIPHRGGPQAPHHYILQPQDAVLKLVMRRSDVPHMAIPKYNLVFELQRVLLSLQEAQYRAVLNTLDYLWTYDVNVKYRRFRPKTTVKEDARAWWGYAINAILSDVRDHRNKWTWAHIKQFRQDKKSYITLYKKASGVPWYQPPTAIEQARLQDLELRLTFEEIIVFRSLADAELKAEGETAAGKASKEKKKKQQNSGWFSRMFGGGGKGGKDQDETVALTAAQREELYATIEYQPDKVVEGATFPPDYVHVKVNFSLSQGTIQLTDKLDPIARVVFEGVNFTTSWRAETSRTEAVLTSLEVFDQFTPGSKFPRLLATSSVGQQVTAVSPGSTRSGDGAPSPVPPASTSLLELVYDSRPTNPVADASLNITLGGTDIYYVVPCVNRIYDFFFAEDLPEASATVGFTAAAAAQFESMKEHTLEQFRTAIETRQKLDVTMDLLAPKVIFIEDATVANSRILLCDLGRFSLTSDLNGPADQSGGDDKSESGTSSRSDHFKQIAAAASQDDITFWDPDDTVTGAEEARFYDHYYLVLSDITAILTTYDADWRTEQGRIDGDMHFVNKFDIRVNLQSIIMSDDRSGLAEYRFSGELTPIHVQLTSTKYRDLMYIWEAFSDPDAAAQASLAPKPVGDGAAGNQATEGVKLDDVVNATRLDTSTTAINAVEYAFTHVFAEGRLSIPDVTITVAQADEMNRHHQPLVSFRLGKLLAHYVQRPFDIRCVLSLRTLQVEDHLQSGDRFRYLVSSDVRSSKKDTTLDDLDELFEGDEEDGLGGPVTDLISASYVAIAPESPNYDGVDAMIECHFNTLELSVNKGTIARLIEFAYAGQTPAQAPAEPQRERAESEQQRHKAHPVRTDSGRLHQEATKTTLVEDRKPPPTRVILVVKLSMEALSMNLNYEDSTLALLTMNNARTELTVRTLDLYSIEGEVGNLAIYNKSDQVGLYPRVFGLRDNSGESLLKYAYTTYSPEFDNYPDYDMNMVVRTASVEIFHVHRFFTELQRFVMDGPWFTLMVQAYTDTSPEAMQAIADDVRRLNMDISVDNPLIHIPIHPASDDMLVGDLGTLVITNTFHQRVDSGVEVPMTSIKVHLQDIHLTSRHGDSDGGSGRILENMTLDVISEMPIDSRHASETLPEMKITGEFSNMAISVTEQQYELMLNVAFKNLLHGYEPERDELDHPSASTPSSTASRTSHALGKSTSVIPMYDVDLNMREISLKTSRTAKGGGHTQLFNLQFETLDLKYRMLKNESATASFFMQSISLADTREDSPNHYKNLIVPFAPLDESDVNQRHITMRYAIDVDENEAWDVEIQHLQAMFIPDVMFEIKDYLVNPFLKVTEEANQMFGKTAEKLAALSGTQDSPSLPRGGRHAVLDEDRVRVGELKVRLFLTAPEAWMLEDPTSPTSRCVIATSPFFMDYTVDVKGLERYKVLVQQFKVFACKPYEAASTNSAILDPVDFTVESQQLRLAPIERRTAVEFSTMDWRMTLGDLTLVSTIIDTIFAADTSPSETAEANAATLGIGEAGRSRAETVILPEKATSLANADLPNSPAMESALLPVAESKRSGADFISYWTFSCHSMHVYFIDDSQSVETPFTRFKFTGAESQIDMRGSKMSIKLCSSFAADYHNIRNILWEPLIEPWDAILNITDSSQQYIVSLASASTLDLNLSSTFLADLKTTLALLDTKAGTEKDHDFSPYWIKNATGMEFRYFVTESDIQVLKPGSKAPIRCDAERQYKGVRAQMDTPPHNSVCLQLKGGWYALRDIPIDKVTTRVFALKPAINGVVTSVVCEVVLEENSKVLYVRSPLVIVNHTDTATQLVLRRVGSQEQILASIAPNDEYNIPLNWTDNCEVAFRPSDGHQWSPFTPLQGLENGSNSSLLCAGTKQTSSTPAWLLLNVTLNRVTDEDDSKLLVPHQRYLNLYAPLVIRNQLPCPLEYRVIVDYDSSPTQLSGTLQPGERAALLSSNLDEHLMLSLKTGDYSWSKNATLGRGTGTSFKLRTLDDDVQLPHPTAHMPDLTLKLDNSELELGRREVLVYCTYWMVNKTGLDLAYKSVGGSQFLSHPSPVPAPRVALEGSEMPWTAKDSPPVLYAEGSLAFGQSKTSVRVEGSKWSKGFSMDSAGYSGSVEIPQHVKRGTQSRTKFMYELGVSIDLAPEEFHMTKIITLTPRYVLKNTLTRTLKIRQDQFALFSTLAPGQHLPFHWPDYEKPFLLTISFEEDGWEWTAPFELGALGERTLKLRSSGPSRLVYMVRVSVHIDGSMASIVFRPEDRRHPPYKINNFSSAPLRFQQKDVPSAMWETLGPQQSSRYCWDAQVKAPKLTMEFGGLVTKAILFDSIREYHKVKLKGRTVTNIVHVYVSAEGPTKVLNIVDDNDLDPSFVPPDVSSMLTEDGQTTESEFTQQRTTPAHISTSQYELRLSRIGISIVDDTPLELVYLSAQDLFVSYVETTLDQEVEVTVAKLQIDNMLPDCRYPVLLAPVPNEEAKNFIHISVVRSLHVTSVDYFKYFSVLVQALSLNVDEALVTRAMTLYTRLPASPHAVEAAPANPEHSKNLYFDILHLQPLLINLSFAKARDRNKQSSRRLAFRAIGVALTNIDRAPMKFRALLLENPFETRQSLMERVQAFYWRQALEEFYVLLGSFEFLGNPVGLLSNVGTGVVDFFYEPAQGLVKSPQDFADGLGRGTSSLFKNSVYGAFNTVSKVSGSVSKGLAGLTMDDDYKREREFRGRQQPGSASEGVLQGAKHFGAGLYQGITGVVTAPIEGAEKDGVTGFMKGFAKGVIGLGVKPVAGVFDLASKTTEGISNQVNKEKLGATRIRAPRTFGRNGELTVYNEDSARGQELLYNLHQGRYVLSDAFHLWMDLPDNVLLLTSRRISLVRKPLKTLKQDWHVPYEYFRDCEAHNAGLRLIILPVPQEDLVREMLSNSPEERWVPCDRGTAEILCEQIRHAFHLFATSGF